MGASVRRGTGTRSVNPWQFVTALRPGPQLRLVSGGYPIEEKELKKLEGVWVRNNAAQYRDKLARELFGFDDLESYDNLTELLKQLRKPKLGERLNPTSLAETLRDSLPPLAGHEVGQLADGWDHLELLRVAVEKTEQSAAVVARFVRQGWRLWVQATVRRQADTLAEATTALDNTTRSKREAEQTLAEATEQLGQVRDEQLRLTGRLGDLETEREELLESSAYQDALVANQRVIELTNVVAGAGRQREGATNRVDRARQSAHRAESDVADATRKFELVESAVSSAAEAVAARAPAAGLAESVARHLNDRDEASLRSELDARLERFGQLRRLHDASQRAQRVVDESARELERRREEESTAIAEESSAQRVTKEAVRALQAGIRDWAGQATVSACTEHQIEAWCDDVTGLTAGRRSVVAEIESHLDQVRERLARTAEELRRRRDPLADREAAASAELEVVRAVTEAAPPVPQLWQRRDRPAPGSGEGAPLWRCLEPAGLDQTTLDLVEAALAASGLLDAWLDPLPGQSTLDTLLEQGPRRDGRTLAAALGATPSGGVTAARIDAVLTSIGWYSAVPVNDEGSWIAADGHWHVGQLRGRVAPAGPASYLGATAREAARQRRIAALEQELERLGIEIAKLDELIAGNTRQTNALARERAAIPGEADVREAVTLLAERARRRGVCAARVTEAHQKYDTDVHRRDEAVAELGRFASEHRFPTTALEAVDRALREYGDSLREWQSKLDVHRARAEAVQAAESTAMEQRERVDAELEALVAIEEELRAQTIRLRTARQNLGADQARLLQRRGELEADIIALRGTEQDLTHRHQTTWRDAERAQLSLNEHEKRRQAAEESRDAALTWWWQLVDAELVGVLGIERPSRRVVETALAGARAVRRQIDVASDPASLNRAWRRCSDALTEMRQELLPNRDARIDESDDTLPRVFILAESGVGWQMPNVAAQTLAERVQEQREAYDAEQHKVLTTLLESTFIEHLKDRLDHTERTFDRINKQLVSHPTRRGQTVKLSWEADPDDPDAGAVVAALRQGYQQLVPERQGIVRAFLARRIEEARSDLNGPADWKERLAVALDYRRWLRIGLRYRPGPGGTWAPFDAARHGAKSGGEKVVLLSQPLFAAAVVAYDAAGPHAPRWVWLDEAMTGVDAEVKASFMGLTVGFELDVMITAFDEWCRYETVPAVAIHDLSRHAHLPGVDSQPYLWCGGEEFRVLTDRLGASPEAVEPTDDLFSLLDGAL